MVQTISNTCAIQRVREVLPCVDGIQVVFENGLWGCLRKGHIEYERMLYNARRSLKFGIPVGCMLNEANELLELSHTHQFPVRGIRPDEEDPTRLVVEFWGYSPICYLTRDHPECERIKDTLEHAVKTDKQVILANHMNMVDGESETWWKLMDVRLA